MSGDTPMQRKQSRNIKRRKWIFVIFLLSLLLGTLWPLTLKEATVTLKPIKNDDFSVNNVNMLGRNVVPQNALAKDADNQLKQSHYIGTALIVHKNKIILQKGYGYADAKTKRLNDAATLFQIASIQKGLTAALVMKEIESGKLSFDTKLSQFYPNVANSDKITISDLITMTSGLSQHIQPVTFESEADNIDFSADHAVVIGEPSIGYGWSYQAVNYRLLAGILMKVTHKTYTQLFDQMFNRHYHLKAVQYDVFKASANRAIGYDDSYDKPYSDNDVAYHRETGTGNVAMTTGNLYRYYYLMINKKMIHSPAQLWQTKPGESYAAGMYHFPKYMTAHGILPGYEPTVILSKKGQDAVVLLSNQYYKQHTFQPLAKKIFTQMTAIPTK